MNNLPIEYLRQMNSKSTTSKFNYYNRNYTRTRMTMNKNFKTYRLENILQISKKH